MGTARPGGSQRTTGATDPATTGEGRAVELVVTPDPLPDLAPTIHRQRLVVEGLCPEAIDDRSIRRYLAELSGVCGMRALMEPVTHHSDRFGWAGWIHWETSGAHFYAWNHPVPFFSVDVYTCNAFDPRRVVDFTHDFFDAERVVARSF